MRINKNEIARGLVYVSVFMAAMYASLQLAIALGIEKKAFYTYAWDLIVGGSTGAFLGLLFFSFVRRYRMGQWGYLRIYRTYLINAGRSLGWTGPQLDCSYSKKS